MSNQPLFLYDNILSLTNELNGRRSEQALLLSTNTSPVQCDCIGFSMPEQATIVTVATSLDGAVWTDIIQFLAPAMKSTLRTFEPTISRYWRVLFLSSKTISVVKLGKAVRMDQRNYQGVDPAIYNQSVNTTPGNLDRGQWLSRQSYGRAGGMSYSFDHVTTKWIREEAMPLIDHLRAGGGVFYAWRPEKYPNDVIYGHLGGPTTISNAGTLDFMDGEISIDGVFDGSTVELPYYPVNDGAE